jgi:hypothetical protein
VTRGTLARAQRQLEGYVIIATRDADYRSDRDQCFVYHATRTVEVFGVNCRNCCAAPLTTDLPALGDFEADAVCIYCGHAFGRVILEGGARE